MSETLVLSGLNGANPLGFLTALGAILTARRFCNAIKLSWSTESGSWRPLLWSCGNDKTEFIKALYEALTSSSYAPFEVDKKLPFSMESFIHALHRVQRESSPDDRRMADFLVAYGSEVHGDKGIFNDTSFRMVRSGDSKGQGLPAYALAIRKATDVDALRRTLFEVWDYRDDDFSLRWDPIEDQRYALRWYDPSSQVNKKFSSRTMRGANALSLEALILFPTFPHTDRLLTTSFYRVERRREFFTWPIWDQPLSLDTIRSLLSLADLYQDNPPRQVLAARGIVEIYRSERIAQNQYYKNFTPAWPA